MNKRVALILVVIMVGAIFFGDNWLKTKILIGASRFLFTVKTLSASQADSPQAAYQGFRRALAQSSVDANKYLSPQAQKAYRFILADPAKQKMILSWPDQIEKLYQIPCAPDDGCLEQAVYRLKYYQEASEVEFKGKIIKLSAGDQERELIFIKRPDGQWWIKRL